MFKHLSARTALVAAVFAAMSCAQAAAQPNQDEVLTALQRSSSAVFLAVKDVQNCQPGTVNGRSVFVCEWCNAYVTADLVPSSARVLQADTLMLRFSKGTGTFAKAVSHSQPQVSPAGEGGVWVGVGASYQQAGGRKLSARSAGLPVAMDNFWASVGKVEVLGTPGQNGQIRYFTRADIKSTLEGRNNSALLATPWSCN